jgi:hypothetical protein
MNFFLERLLLLFWAELPRAIIFIMKLFLLRIILNLGPIEVFLFIYIILILALY